MSTKTCPECGSANPVSEEMCDQCGCMLGDVDPTVTDTPADPEPDALSCASCGKAVTADMRFCDGCGAGLQAPVAPPEPIKMTQQLPDDEPEPEPELDHSQTLEPDEPDIHNAQTLDPDEPPPVPDRSWKLACVEGFRLGKEYLLFKDDMLLGRLDAENEIFPDIELEDQDDGYVSRRHARITQRRGIVYVEDLGGENGTLLDGRPLPPLKAFEIQEGQVIRLGKVGLMLKPHGEVKH
ncbi:MAG: FHA domain-containing protein [Acidobacteriota bacterium]|nr:FHA domain-containing protein [Acidobacteriota bacterium]